MLRTDRYEETRLALHVPGSSWMNHKAWVSWWSFCVCWVGVECSLKGLQLFCSTLSHLWFHWTNFMQICLLDIKQPRLGWFVVSFHLLLYLLSEDVWTNVSLGLAVSDTSTSYVSRDFVSLLITTLLALEAPHSLLYITCRTYSSSCHCVSHIQLS